jgi:hypothetical protein
VHELAWRIDAVRVILNTQVAVALVLSVLLVLWLWRRELAAGATVLVEPQQSLNRDGRTCMGWCAMPT